MRKSRTLTAGAVALAVTGGLLLGAASPAPAASAPEPTPPSNLRVTGVGQFSADLAWQPSSLGGPVRPGDTPLYFVQDSSGKMLASFAKNATSGTVTRLTPSTSYTVRLLAWNGSLDASPKSNPVTFTTDSAQPLPVPTNLRPLENKTGTDVTVDFDVAADPRVSRYEVTDGAGRHVSAGFFTNQTRFVVGGLKPQTEYRFAVSAVMKTSSSGEWVGKPSEPLVVTTPRDGQPPATPLGVTFVDRTGTSVTLAWGVNDPTFPPTDNVGVVDFLVSNGETTRVVPGDGSPIMSAQRTVFGGLRPETSYTFTVRARDAAGNVSEPTAPRTITTGVDPDTVAPTAVGNLWGFGAKENNGWTTVVWDPSTDNVTLASALRYRLTTDRGEEATVGGTSYVGNPSGGNPPLQGCKVTVVAVDRAGNISQPRSTSLC
jgi:hypothetical protein